ncbi:hypothetical protein H1C71_027615, partial [Ictidomys tridecemlineatus]
KGARAPRSALGHPGQETVSVANRIKITSNMVPGDPGLKGPGCSASDSTRRPSERVEASKSPAVLGPVSSTLVLGTSGPATTFTGCSGLLTTKSFLQTGSCFRRFLSRYKPCTQILTRQAPEH